MRILVPVDASAAALAPILRLAQYRTNAEVLVLNVQPLFHRHVAQFTSRAAREQVRAERSTRAMAHAIDTLASAGVSFRALSEAGRPAERIAAVAEREQVDEIMIGVGRHPAWLRWLNPSISQGVMALTDIPVTVLARGHPTAFQRYAVPAGVAGIAALLISAE